MRSHDEDRTESSKSAEKSNDKGSLKKTYYSPQLFNYGDIRDVTQNVGNMGALDNGAAPTKRSSV